MTARRSSTPVHTNPPVPERRHAYPDNPVMAIMWAGAIQHAVGDAEAIAAYEAARGRRFRISVRRSPIDRMIDEATGYEEAALADFVDWFNAEVWGEDPFATSAPAPVAASTPHRAPAKARRDVRRQKARKNTLREVLAVISDRAVHLGLE